jgi:uncharacterized delta-60 repeat protein
MIRTPMLAAAIASVVLQSGPGSLDTSFGDRGKVITNVGLRCVEYAPGSGANALALQGDGKIVAGGWSWDGCSLGYRFALARFGRNGALDRSFGVNGRVSSGGDRESSIHAIVLRDDGKIVAGGWIWNGGDDYDFALTRYLASGALDRRFGNEGVASSPEPGVQQINAIALEPDGEIIAAGWSGGDFALLRLSSRGEFDPSFGSDGVVTTSFGPGLAIAYALRIQRDGKLLAAGISDVSDGNVSAALARYTPDGELDPSFGAGGKVLLPGLSFARALVIQPNGKIVVAGSSRSSFGVARLNKDGSPDVGFGSGGLAAPSFGLGSDAFGGARSRDGRLVVVGSARGNFAVARYRQDGSVDSTFGHRGKLTTPLDYGYDIARDVVIQRGKILVAGTMDSNLFGLEGDTNARFALVRYRG